MATTQKSFRKFLYLRINFLMAFAAALGSLYFSEILKYPPCVLCWYQRISLYPLVVIFGTALWLEDISYRRYAIPLAIIGFVIAGYHNLIYYGLISEELTPCTEGVSCSSRQLELFGFVTIPLLSLIGFFIILALMIIERSKATGGTNEK
ncbi:MAG: disulfide bond formation protein B [Pseudobdellovibrionaceae bacterium]